MKKKVLVAMSGGVDSSVAAMMLKEQGYDIYGVTMKTWDYKGTTIKKKMIGCCNLDSINDAREVAVKYDFPHIILDIKREFGNYVINNFKSEYLKGRTPNPCILCNTHIKWDALLQKANMLGCEYIATGHYAQVKKKNNRYFISKGIDLNKDQSYALWGLSQDSLKRTLLPLGNHKKPFIKQFAYERGFENISKKPESYEICFIPDNDYRQFLKKSINNFEEKIKEGDFILKDGSKVGTHKGYPFYTIGQRKGLGIALGYPIYVIEIKPKDNIVILGTFDDLSKNGMNVSKLNMMKYQNLNNIKFQSTTKVRYNDPGTSSVIDQKDDVMKVYFGSCVKSVAPGQAAVFYENEDVIGGGWIDSSFD